MKFLYDLSLDGVEHNLALNFALEADVLGLPAIFELNTELIGLFDASYGDSDVGLGILALFCELLFLFLIPFRVSAIKFRSGDEENFPVDFVDFDRSLVNNFDSLITLDAEQELVEYYVSLNTSVEVIAR